MLPVESSFGLLPVSDRPSCQVEKRREGVSLKGRQDVTYIPHFSSILKKSKLFAKPEKSEDYAWRICSNIISERKAVTGSEISDERENNISGISPEILESSYYDEDGVC